ncbi:MAG: IS3 family transposase [Bacteroidales bacterium]|nr:IS3 family transposase [Bacteroidales bacterium]
MPQDRECSVKKSEGLSRGKERPSARDRAKAIEELRPECSLELLLKFGKMARSTFYYNAKRLGQPDGYDAIREHIRKIYHKHHGRYGYRRITDQLHDDGVDINHKTVQKLMGQMGLKAKRKKQRYNSYKGELGKIAPNVINRDFHADAPDQKWATDVTQVKIKDSWVYLSPVLDMFNGEIVSYVISDRPDLKMVMTMLDKAFNKRNIQGNLIFHSDQGWHYQHKRYQKALEDRHITQSMSRKGNCLDNAMMENFFGLMKNELLYLQEWDSIDQFKKALRKYIWYYNNDRIKLRLKGKSPVQYRALFQSKAS